MSDAAARNDCYGAEKAQMPDAVWQWSPHEFVDNGGVCWLCQALPDRAIHVKQWALKNGYGFIEPAHNDDSRSAD